MGCDSKKAVRGKDSHFAQSGGPSVNKYSSGLDRERFPVTGKIWAAKTLARNRHPARSHKGPRAKRKQGGAPLESVLRGKANTFPAAQCTCSRPVRVHEDVARVLRIPGRGSFAKVSSALLNLLQAHQSFAVQESDNLALAFRDPGIERRSLPAVLLAPAAARHGGSNTYVRSPTFGSRRTIINYNHFPVGSRKILPPARLRSLFSIKRFRDYTYR